MKDVGLGAVVLDQVPEHLGHYQSNVGRDLKILSDKLACMYFYCAPRTPSKSITMTFDQAWATAEFLKETI